MNTTKSILLTGIAVALMVLTAYADEAAAKPAAQAAVPAKPAAQAAKPADGKTYKPIAEARAKIGEIIENPSKMTETLKELSPEDQKQFVAEVNAAIAKLPGSVEEKTAKYLNVNKAALKGASQGNMVNILATTFATVPPESLTVISESYANDLFNRDTEAANKQLPDAAYEKTAKEVIGKVVAATSGSDDSGVRNTLAVLMFVKADNGKIEGLADRLVETLPDATTRELAKSEWIPAAMATGDSKSYDGMLAYADAGKAPDLNVVLNMAGPQIMEAMTVDITSGMNNDEGVQTTPVLDQAFGGFDEPRVNLINDDTTSLNQGNAGVAIPRTTDPTKPWNPKYTRDDPDKPNTPPEPEPKPYAYTEM